MFGKTIGMLTVILVCYSFSLSEISNSSVQLETRKSGYNVMSVNLKPSETNKTFSYDDLITQLERGLETRVLLGNFKVTAYDLSYDCCSKSRGHKDFGKTRSGKSLVGLSRKQAKSIAVDPRVIPLGSTVYISFDDGYSEYDGTYTALDTGGAIKGKTIDLFLGDFGLEREHPSVANFGIKYAEVSMPKEPTMSREEFIEVVLNLGVAGLNKVNDETFEKLMDALDMEYQGGNKRAKLYVDLFLSSVKGLELDWSTLIIEAHSDAKLILFDQTPREYWNHIKLNTVSARLLGSAPKLDHLDIRIDTVRKWLANRSIY